MFFSGIGEDATQVTEGITGQLATCIHGITSLIGSPGGGERETANGRQGVLHTGSFITSTVIQGTDIYTSCGESGKPQPKEESVSFT